MKISAAGATDGGNIALFWPDNLPDGIDGKSPGELFEVISKLCDEGKLIWFLCDGDGDFNVDIFIDEPLPPHLTELFENEEVIPRLTVRDVGYFGGLEYLFKEDNSMSRRYPGMIERVELPEGIYAATVCRTRWKEDFRRSWLIKHSGRASYLIWKSVNDFAFPTLLLTGFAAFLFGIASVVLLFAKRPVFLWQVWVVFAMTFAAEIAIVTAATGVPWYRRASEAVKAFSKTYPTFVVKLTKAA